MSHELRTPLNAILGYATILKRRVEHRGPLVEGLDIISQSGAHLLTLINDVLDLAKIEAGKLELHPAPVNLPTFLRQVTGIMRARAEAKELSLTYEALSPLPATVLTDETRLRQVLLNLLGNAVKFTDRGHVALTVAIIDEAETEGGEPQVTLRCQVEDTGVGIAPGQSERIFRAFEQVGEAGKRAKGTGLGLALSQEILSMMGSRLQVKSTPGHGSTFWCDVVLPVAAADERERLAPADNITGYEGAPRRVLVADDKPYSRLMLRDILEPLGFEVSAAGDGQQALDRAREAHPDVILMDLVMPVKTGFVATQELRQRPEFTDLVIIAISASVLEADREKSLMAGCDAFLPKPVHVDELLDALASHLTLNWIYAEPEAGAEGAASLAPPSPEVLAALPLDMLSALE
ncbi:MAG: response regulator, partial [Delftia sp.]|nr:response regulator [Delftia sp.]